MCSYFDHIVLTLSWCCDRSVFSSSTGVQLRTPKLFCCASSRSSPTGTFPSPRSVSHRLGIHIPCQLANLRPRVAFVSVVANLAPPVLQSFKQITLKIRFNRSGQVRCVFRPAHEPCFPLNDVFPQGPYVRGDDRKAKPICHKQDAALKDIPIGQG